MKRIPSLILFAASALLVASPAAAARLESWQYDANQNRLEFTTDEDVQPTAQLVNNPTRLVIDLPGIILGRPVVNRSFNGTIRSVRVGQFDRGTTRLVIELAPGYTIDPQQVKFRGISARHWTVQLPDPQRSPVTPVPPSDSTVVPTTISPTAARPLPLPAGARTQLRGIQVTQDGFFLRTVGNSPDIRVTRSGDRQQIFLDLPATNLAIGIPREMLVNRFGVSRMQFTQVSTSPPTARITLNVDRSAPDWLATVSSLGGVVLIPSGGATVTTNPIRPTLSSPIAANVSRIATIRTVELENNQLVIRADSPLSYNTSWDRASGSYRITLNSAQLASNVRGPQLTAASPILRLRLRQEDARTAVILVQPASGVQIGEINQPAQQVVALQLQRSRTALIPPQGLPNRGTSIPVPVAPRTPQATPVVPRINNGRPVVVVDPGHGGPDPGAIGIGGLQEKGIVLDIGTQVAQILEQQGVQAILTRTDDRDLGLEPRVQLAESVNATVFVSIHANSISLSRPDISGLETYYYSSGEQLARTIHQSILEATGVPDRRVRSARFYVLRRTSMPSVLVEIGFVTGQDDAARLSNPSFRRQMAAAIARGILQYIR